MLISILTFPFRLARAPLTLVVMALRPRRRALALPVAGLHEAKAQSIYFALRRAATTHEEEAVGLQWLAGLQVAQVGSERILAELDAVEANLRFWTRRLDAKQHFWFTLLRHGPVAFGRRLAALARGAGRRRRRQLQLAAGEAVEAAEEAPTDLEVVEKRVLIFRVLRSELCEAAAAVQAAAAALHLQGAPGDGEQLFPRAREAVEVAMAGVACAFTELESGVGATLEGQAAPEGPAAGDRPMLTQALGRVLGMTHLHHIWTQHQELSPQAQREPQAAAAVAAEVAAAPEGEGAPAPAVAAQRAVGFVPLVTPETTVHEALGAARRAAAAHAAAGRRLAPLPSWLLMPSRLQQNWVRYALAGAAAGYGVIFLVRHSRLGGSDDLERWGRAAAGGVRAAWADHVIGPLERVRGELFATFRSRPAIVSMAEYEADRDSLQRMLDDFRDDYVRRRGAAVAAAAAPGAGNATAVAPAPGGEVVAQGMELMMRSYEEELKRPMRNLVSGDLARSLLIQVQKLKVDTESAMLEIDQILRANELSISLVAAVPAFLLAGAALYGVGQAVTPAPPDPRREAVPARLAMVEAERALEALAAAEEGAPGAPRGAEAAGLFAYCLAVAYGEAEALYARHRGVFTASGASEWPALRDDLLGLAAPAPAPAKLRTAARMVRAYSIYQQF